MHDGVNLGTRNLHFFQIHQFRRVLACNRILLPLARVKPQRGADLERFARIQNYIAANTAITREHPGSRLNSPSRNISLPLLYTIIFFSRLNPAWIKASSRRRSRRHKSRIKSARAAARSIVIQRGCQDDNWIALISFVADNAARRARRT